MFKSCKRSCCVSVRRGASAFDVSSSRLFAQSQLVNFFSSAEARSPHQLRFAKIYTLRSPNTLFFTVFLQIAHHLEVLFLAFVSLAKANSATN
jgi:hypothetical protein